MKLNWRALALHLGILVLITGLIWGATVWHWESSSRDVSDRDIAVFFVALPLVGFVIWLLLRRAWQRSAVPPAAAVAAAASAASVAAAPADAVGPDEASRHWTFPLRWAQVCSVASGGTDGLVQALTSDDHRLELDPELSDPDGARMLSGRSTELPLDAVLETLQALIQDQPAPVRANWAGAESDEPFVRTLALLETVGPEALAALAEDAPAQPGARPVDTPTRMLWIALPQSWPEERRSLAQAWIERQLLASVPDTAAPSLQMLWATDGESVLRQVDAALGEARRGSRPVSLLLLAADTRVDERCITRWHAEGVLLSGTRTVGRVPGEAAAAVLLSSAPPPSAPSPDSGDTPPVVIGRLAHLRRERSADERGAVSAEALTDTVRAAAQAFGADPTAVSVALTDVDLRPRPMQEAVAALQAVCPALDPIDGVRRLGQAIGDAGLATPVVQLALAAAESQQGGAPVVLLCCADAHERLAVVVGPLPPSPSPSASA